MDQKLCGTCGNNRTLLQVREIIEARPYEDVLTRSKDLMEELQQLRAKMVKVERVVAQARISIIASSDLEMKQALFGYDAEVTKPLVKSVESATNLRPRRQEVKLLKQTLFDLLEHHDDVCDLPRCQCPPPPDRSSTPFPEEVVARARELIK